MLDLFVIGVSVKYLRFCAFFARSEQRGHELSVQISHRQLTDDDGILYVCEVLSWWN